MGAVLLLLPIVGWCLNMGHRIRIVHRLQHGQEAWPAWGGYGELFKHGVVTAGGMLYYYSPAIVLAAVAWRSRTPWLCAPAAALFLAATVAIPGSHFCRSFDAAEIYNPFKALHRVIEGGTAYWRAWAIALSALGLSFLGLLALGVGFLVTSVWLWQTAGFSFATVFSSRFELTRDSNLGAGE